MSRGPGIWQRRILDAVERLDQDQMWVVESIVRHYVGSPTRSNLAAAVRAARRLSEDGRIKVGMEYFQVGRRVIVARADTTYEPVFNMWMDCPAWYTLRSPWDVRFETEAVAMFGEDTDGCEWRTPRERVAIAARRALHRGELVVPHE